MSAILPKSRFLRLPKTGSVWAEQTISACVKGTRVIHIPHAHTDRHQTPGKELFTFTFVRHPMTWYRSYWTYKMIAGWDARNSFDQRCKTDSFDSFIRIAVLNFYSHLDGIYEDFTGTPDDPIDFIGRYENLEEDLRKALTLAGEEVDWKEFDRRCGKPKNVSTNKWKEKAVLTDTLLTMLSISESDVFRRFNYNPEEYE